MAAIGWLQTSRLGSAALLLVRAVSGLGVVADRLSHRGVSPEDWNWRKEHYQSMANKYFVLQLWVNLCLVAHHGPHEYRNSDR